jgi:hypothetical protein
MPSSLSPLISLIVVVFLTVLACVAAGAVLTLYVMRRASALASNLVRTGSPDPLPAPDASEIRAPSAEAAAQARVLHDAIERGADQLQAVGKANGRPLSREQALKDAAAMLNAPPLGGVQ